VTRRASVGPTFEQRLRVVAADLDEQNHVNNVVYVRWVQDIATAHWRALATPELRAELAWVARRHEIDYLAPALLDDDLLVHTRVGHAEGLLFERHTEISRLADGRALARSRTLWIPVDARTGRPRRVGAEVRALVSVPDDPPASAPGRSPA
jgi:acyl-CoA thioester hydrolase